MVRRIAGIMALIAFTLCLVMGILAENGFATTLLRTQGDGRDFFRRAAGRIDGTTHVKRKLIGLTKIIGNRRK